MTRNIMKRDLMAEVLTFGQLASLYALPFPDETHRCFDKPIVARLPCIELKCGVNIGVLYDTNKLERDVRSLRNYA